MTMLKSVTRQENKYLENTLLDRPCPARRHMCMSQKLQHNNSNVDRGAAAAIVGLGHNLTTPDK